MAKRQRYVLYQSNAFGASPRWHAWHADAPASVCNMATNKNQIVDEVSKRVPDQLCAHCARRLGIEQQRAPKTAPKRAQQLQHIPKTSCACELCRNNRTADVRKYAEYNVPVSVNALVCPCVITRATFEEHTPEIKRVRGAEERLAHALFVWETTGGAAEFAEIPEAHRHLLRMWKYAAYSFGLQDCTTHKQVRET